MTTSALNNKRILITGGAGFIGSHLAERLLLLGCAVTALDNLSATGRRNVAHLEGEPGFKLTVGDVRDAALVETCVAEADLVFHLAAAVGVARIVQAPLESLETNIIGTHVVMAAASKLQKKVFLASTSEVYGKGTRIPFREDDDTLAGPTSIARWSYAAAKAADEFLALAYWQERRLPVVVARFFNTIGPRQTGQYGMVVPRFVQQALAGEPLTVHGDGSQSRCFCDVADVVDAALRLAQNPAAEGQVFNIGGSQEITILQLAQQVIAQAGELAPPARTSGVRFIPYNEVYGPGFEDMQRRVPDTARLRRLTGWEPQVPLEETIRKIIAQQQTATAERSSL